MSLLDEFGKQIKRSSGLKRKATRAEKRRALRHTLKAIPWRPFRNHHGIKPKLPFSKRFTLAQAILGGARE